MKMEYVPFRRKVANSPIGPAVVFAYRTRDIVRYDVRYLRRSARWLFGSREYANYTYDLTPVNLGQLAWFVANVTGSQVGDVKGYIDELQNDQGLIEHLKAATMASDQSKLADPIPRFGRRLGWYALVRALKPDHVVETGTDKGLGSMCLAAALLRNGTGRLTTMDIQPKAGYLISGKWADVVDYQQGDSHQLIPHLTKPVDFFLHDSLHTTEHEIGELRLIEPHLSDSSVVLSDTADYTTIAQDWAEARGWRYFFFMEQPADHWFWGGGIGLARR